MFGGLFGEGVGPSVPGTISTGPQLVASRRGIKFFVYGRRRESLGLVCGCDSTQIIPCGCMVMADVESQAGGRLRYICKAVWQSEIMPMGVSIDSRNDCSTENENTHFLHLASLQPNLSFSSSHRINTLTLLSLFIHSK